VSPAIPEDLDRRVRVFFADFVLDRGTRQLLRAGEEQHLEPKLFELLDLLVSRGPAAVSKNEIRDRVWPGTFVADSSLSSVVAQIRRALGDDRRRPRFVRTVHGFGYAFLPETRQAPARAGAADPRRRAACQVRPMVFWDKDVFPLAQGENLLGRDPDVSVRIDSPGVSRRHARIVVSGGSATLEDLGSKNGTYLREQRIARPAVLADGDTFRLGRLPLVFRMVADAGSTRTEGGGY
jgi:DNA-binding winged helix-turn-helix (wHTH) protein